MRAFSCSYRFLIGLFIIAASTTSCDSDDDMTVPNPPPSNPQVTAIGCLSAQGAGGLEQIPKAVAGLRQFLGQVSVPGLTNDLAGLLDAQITGITGAILQQFRVFPAVRLFDDGMSPNAYAIPINTEQSSVGTIRVGGNLVAMEARQFLQNDYGRNSKYVTYSITAVIAHETGHILQFTRGVRTPGRNTELQADFLAGWYFSFLAVNDPLFAPNNGALDGMQAFYSRGDYQFNYPGHHGTPQERLSAFNAGLNARIVGVNAAWNAAVSFRNMIGG